MILNFIPIKTRIVNPPKDEIWDILDELDVYDGDIIFITSKIMAIHQGRCVLSSQASKEELIKQESSAYLSYENRGGFHVNLTITDNILISSAGIDESNSNGHLILWPKNIDKLCAEFRNYLINKKHIKNLGIIATDSHTTPLRLGVTGLTIGLAGIEPLKDIRGLEDIFGRTIKITQVNQIDPLTSMAVLLMGETSERVPIIILRGYNSIEFNENGNMDNFKISPEMDKFQPLLEVLKENKRQ